MAQQSEAAEVAAARQLAFIDRLLVDKEGLARRCAEGDRLLKVSVLGSRNATDHCKQGRLRVERRS